MIYKNRSLFIFWMLTCFLCGAVIFLDGFFPASYQKVNTESMEWPASQPTEIDGFRLSFPTKQYDQVIFMVIDALRSDFPTNNTMPTVMNSSCHSLTLHVDIPTVTMPRIKSMMTGTVSNFIDIIFNLGHTRKVEDSIIHRLKERHDVIVFAGDDTWTKLFQSEFTRYEANNDSLFVQDFFEGDKNVSRTLRRELNQEDWGLLILHYLGLDHIGHVEGTSSSKIPKKLEEMDNEVKTIINSKNFKNRLLILTSDHGMRNGGGHGGSTLEETNVPLFIFNSDCPKRTKSSIKYNQIDLTPTLAIIFSTAIPRKSIGRLIPEFLQTYSLEDQLYAYYYNAKHLIETFTEQFGDEELQNSDFYSWFKSAKEDHKSFLKAMRSNVGTSSYMFEKAKQDYGRSSEAISIILADSLVNFNYSLIFIGLSLASLSTVYTLLVVLFQPSRSSFDDKMLSKTWIVSLSLATLLNFFAHMFNLIEVRNIWYSLFLTVPISASIYIIIKIIFLLMNIVLPLNPHKSLRISLNLPWPYLAAFFFHTFSLVSSSFIEEEHQTWYYLGPTMLLMTFALGFWKSVRKTVFGNDKDLLTKISEEVVGMQRSIFMLLFLALLRRLNQTGDKWAHIPDVGDFLNREEYIFSLTMFFLFGLVNLILRMRFWLNKVQMIGAIISGASIYCFRGMTGSLLFPSKEHFGSPSIIFVLILFWIGVGVVFSVPYKNLVFKKNLYGYEPKSNMIEILQANLSSSLLVAALLHKPHNVLLLPAMTFTLGISYHLCDIINSSSLKDFSYSLVQKTVLTIFISNMFYFYQGNSNSLSTIDLNPGYIGQSSYNPLIVGVFVTLNTYSAQINAFLFLVLHMFKRHSQYLPQRQEKEQLSNSFIVQTNEADLHLVISLYAAFTMLPVAFYLCLLVAFRYHLFIYSVFAPKAFYVCYSVLVFYINFCLTKLYFKIFKQ